MLLVTNPNFPIKTVAELIERARQEPGRIDFGSGDVGSTPHMAGELFCLHYRTTSTCRISPIKEENNQRSPIAPDIPTIAATVSPGFGAVTWFGVVAPKVTPRAIIVQLGMKISKAASDARFRHSLQAGGMSIHALDPAAFDAYIADKYVQWQRVIRQARITTQ